MKETIEVGRYYIRQDYQRVLVVEADARWVVYRTGRRFKALHPARFAKKMRGPEGASP